MGFGLAKISVMRTISREDSGSSLASGPSPINVSSQIYSYIHYSGQEGNDENLGRTISSRQRWSQARGRNHGFHRLMGGCYHYALSKAIWTHNN
jgi:hypothetical protein